MCIEGWLATPAVDPFVDDATLRRLNASARIVAVVSAGIAGDKERVGLAPELPGTLKADRPGDCDRKDRIRLLTFPSDSASLTEIELLPGAGTCSQKTLSCGRLRI
jgi:hypothetical protein